MANRQQRAAKKKARREKRVARRPAYLRRTLPALPFRKISEQLLDFATPLLEPLMPNITADEARPFLNFAATVWNLARLMDEGGGGDLETKIVDSLAAGTVSRSEASEMLADFVKRKRELFDDPRIIEHFDVYDTPDGIHVIAAATL
jgi:hypothetical protein